MEHREVKTPEQIAELKKRSPGGYRNLRESVINELPVLGTPTTATSGRSPEFRKGSNPNPVEFVEDLITEGRTKGMPGASLGDAVRMLPTPVTTDGTNRDVANQVLTRNSLSLQSITAILDMPKDTWEKTDLSRNKARQVGESAKRREEAASLLPTPSVAHLRNHDEPVENYLQRRQDFTEGRTKGMPGASLGVAVRMEMLPTVTVQDGKNTAGKSQFQRNTLPLNAEVTLLGTPRVSAANSSTPKQVEADAPKSRIEDQVLITNWGKFEPAIRRWESLTRIAPSPTKPDGKDGNHRLSAEFTEWMMGLPEGWVTAEDIGLKRNDQLKACGNGVVPQQAELALRILLDGMTFEPENSGGGKIAMLPTPTVSDTYTDNLKSSQQKEGSMHSVTLPQAIRQINKLE